MHTRNIKSFLLLKSKEIKNLKTYDYGSYSWKLDFAHCTSPLLVERKIVINP